MTKDIFELFAKYNKGANEKMDAILQTLSAEEWDRQFAGFFKSVRGLCSHTYIADHTWLCRFKAAYNFKSLSGELFAAPYSFKETLFQSPAEYFAKRPELDKVIVDFINEIPAGDLDKPFKWTTSTGSAFEKKTGAALLHVFNHQSHHRGMVSLYLEMLGKDNDFAGLVMYA